MRQQLDQERQLVELVQTLETPVVPIADGVLLAPLVGAIDSRRAEALHARLLRELYERRARVVIVDLSGIPDADTLVAQQLIRLTQALGLLGADVVLCGISPMIAITLTHIGIDMRAIQIAATVQEALNLAAPQSVHMAGRSMRYN
jgi:anti-anti-sigma regulatory factor